MQGISLSENGAFLEIGAAEPLAKIAAHPLVRTTHLRSHKPALSLVRHKFAAAPHWGGNLANASPAADTPIALAALGAEVLKRCNGTERPIPILETIAGISRSALNPGELLVRFRIPIQKNRSAFAKIGSRKDVSIARLNMALSVDIDKDAIHSARIFIGTLGIPVPAPEAERALQKSGIYGDTAPYLDALTAVAEKSIPGRYSLPYKRVAIRGLGEDLIKVLREENPS
jgi:Xanthine dehydrogenase, iron-sulfur cluster and FAD-binding subunit A